MKKLFATIVVLTLAVSAFFLTGCGSNDNGDDAARDYVNVGWSARIMMLDPIGTNSTQEFILYNSIFSTLVTFDSNDNLQLDLASSWHHSDDHLTYTFVVREDVSFHDGTPLTIHDVLYSINERMEDSWAAAGFAAFDTVEIVGNSIVINLHFRDRAIMRSLAQIYVVPEAQHSALGREGFADAINGSGPFFLYDFDHATGNFTIVRNDNYHGTAPYLREINSRWIADASTRIIALETGEIDFANIPLDPIDLVRAHADLEVLLVDADTTFFLNFNTTQAPFDNPALRRAIAHAIDHEAVGIVHASEGITVTTELQTPMWRRLPAPANVITFDRDYALQILADAGIQTPIDIGEFLVMTPQAHIGVQIQSDLRVIGIETTLTTLDPGMWVPRFVASDFMFTVSSQLPDICFVRYFTNSFQSDSPGNAVGYNNPAMDALIIQLNDAATDAEADAVVVQILEILYADVPLMALFQPQSSYGFNRNLVVEKGISCSRYGGFQELRWAN